MTESDSAKASTLLQVAIGDSFWKELQKGPVTLEFIGPPPIMLVIKLADDVKAALGPEDSPQ